MQEGLRPHRMKTAQNGICVGIRWNLEKLFQQDLKPKAAAVNARVSVPLYQGQYDASVSLVYNIGEGAFAKSTALKRINAGRHEEVPAQIKRWNKAGGKVVKGLARRREAEAELYRMRWY